MAPPNIERLTAHAVRVPMPHPHRTAAGTVHESPLVLVELRTSDGVRGRGMAFTYCVEALAPTARLIDDAAPLLVGAALSPADVSRTLTAKFRLVGTHGLTGMAIAAIDMAVWDALARSAGSRWCGCSAPALVPSRCTAASATTALTSPLLGLRPGSSRGCAGSSRRSATRRSRRTSRWCGRSALPSVPTSRSWSTTTSHSTRPRPGCGYAPSTTRASRGSRSRWPATITPAWPRSPARSARRCRPGKAGGPEEFGPPSDSARATT